VIATIRLDFHSSDTSKQVFEAISPDNTPLPPGLSIDCSIEETRLVITIQCERNIDSLGATIEDIMSAIDLSLRTSQLAEQT